MLRDKWLPGASDSAEDLATAAWLERNYWERFGASVADGITKAFKGK
uniref:Uncharacterized protein n=1 Tax=Candidatus Kentrum sp. FM TaxID=2126340 RepID=A0A450RX28_9GAMM|nr:MAG: hypothetical protein BECKFM1743A_GA0114220_1000323 [Candidatus Kentron sp. FM]VFJ43673.1 MAG: hypothetical protein BECKFM1743C_GA0114222_1000323 [Candidatus Kentron sp. FM]VFK05663.1 MAG: hypothetical protein BECKFM1743B_GA0114221_1000323 [Candidatus Kentron sp. FM]